MLLRVLCVLCGLSCFSFALDRHAFTFTDYRLTITVDPAKSALSAQGTVTLHNETSEPQKEAVLQVSSSLDWKSISLGGKPVQYLTQPYTSDLDHTGELSEAIVTLPTAVPPNAGVELEIAYAGTLTAVSTRLTRIGVPEKTALSSDWDRLGDPYGVIRGIGYVAWYPIATEAQSLSDGAAVFREIGAWQQREVGATMELSVVNSGAGALQANAASSSSGCRDAKGACFRWQPLGWTVPVLIYGSYETLSPSGSRIDHLAGRQSLAEDYARAVTQVRPVVAQWFGEPKQPVHVVELPWPGSAGWESGTLFLTPLKQSLAEPLRLQMIHQLTHAALVSSRPWIFEGAAEFAQALERERQGGRRAAIEFMEEQAGPLVAAQQPILPDAPGRHDAAPPRPLQPLATTSDELFYRLKAMRVWWMLRELVGDAALQRALQNYKSADDREPSYMQRLIEGETQRKLEWFFDDWVYRDRGLPDFRVDAAYPRPLLAGGYTLTITIENQGDAGAEVPVTVETSHGQVTRRLLVRGREKAYIHIEVPEAPKRVTVNDGSVPELNTTNNSFDVKIPGK